MEINIEYFDIVAFISFQKDFKVSIFSSSNFIFSHYKRDRNQVKTVGGKRLIFWRIDDRETEIQ